MTTQQRHPGTGQFGPNQWLVDELYQQYLADKSSVDQAWWDFFKDYRPAESGPATTNGSSSPAAPAAQAAPATDTSDGPAPAAPVADGTPLPSRSPRSLRPRR